MAAQHATMSALEPVLVPAGRRAALLGVLGVHLVAAWALLQAKSVREAVVEVAPLFVRLVPLPTPAQPAPIPPNPQIRHRDPPPRPRSPVAAPAMPATTPQTLALPVPAPDARPPSPQRAPTVAEASPAAAVAPAPPIHAVPAAPAAPRAVPTTAVRYTVEPEPAYPATSRRLGEAGEVRLRVEIGTDGRARHVSVHHSSGFPRLDESAVAAVRAARFAPYTEHGVALVVWTIVPIAFELQS